MRSASNPHAFMGVTEQGLAAIVRTRGNQDVHVILRGGSKGPNYQKEHVQAAAAALKKVRPDSHPSIMVDASRECSFVIIYHRLPPSLSIIFLIIAWHMSLKRPVPQIDGNSLKNHNNQPKVVADVCEQLVAGDTTLTGVMIESNIAAGRQDVPPEGPQGLKWGVSITDACIDWETTVDVLQRLNEASKRRRAVVLEASIAERISNGPGRTVTIQIWSAGSLSLLSYIFFLCFFVIIFVHFIPLHTYEP
jgi:3-deoxy-7-phosphoheptulonate synthase